MKNKKKKYKTLKCKAILCIAFVVLIVALTTGSTLCAVTNGYFTSDKYVPNGTYSIEDYTRLDCSAKTLTNWSRSGNNIYFNTGANGSLPSKGSYFTVLCVQYNTGYVIPNLTISGANASGNIPSQFGWSVSSYLDTDTDVTIQLPAGEANNIGQVIFVAFAPVGTITVPFNSQTIYSWFLDIRADFMGLTVNGVQDAFSRGFTAGQAEEQTTRTSFVTLVGDVVAAPFTAISNMLSFDVLGINVAGAVFTLITLALVALLIRKLT